MPSTGAPSTESLAALSRFFTDCPDLIGPTALTTAALLLDDLSGAALVHGHTVNSPGMNWLVNAAAEATLQRLRSREQPIRPASETAPLLDRLRAALRDAGLDAVPGTRSGVTVAVPPGRPTSVSSSELTIALHRGWELTINSAGSSVVSVRAPVTENGAVEIAGIVRDILSGGHGNPFR
ncbi:hypothetical protein [Kitasatospora sp. GP82]|uniref:hypothetical protein n=1 Tax=Kitasatospora sp. GP82 TaxID=3035089 RepID=UPI0024733BB9|nr:hypothetical protein [Kitasatospora sp. GP82]MDH6128807.1 hypothetical protein [Kitasatospora sp. GP82]